jgi:hypothetical protein
MVWNSNWLREDRKLIASCLSTTSLEDCVLEVENHHFRQQMSGSFVARWFLAISSGTGGGLDGRRMMPGDDT